MSENLKKCKVYGRTITDKNNITGLCPKHQKVANTAGATVGLVGLGITVKKFAPKALKLLSDKFERRPLDGHRS